MIRPFALADILLVQRLQRDRAVLAIEHNLTHPRSPLWLALTAPWPWAGLGVATYVLRERHHGALVAGFIQLRKRASRPEADLFYIAPGLTDDRHDGDQGIEATWHRLLLHCCREAGQRGLERVFVGAPEDGPAQMCLTDAGFRPYTTETIYRLASPVAAKPGISGFRPQQPQDNWALQRLYNRGTPRLVQQAEGALTGRVGSPPVSWWEPQRWRGAVLTSAGEVRGAVQVHPGRAGHWLRVWGTNSLTGRELEGLVQEGLQLLAAGPRQRLTGEAPVYCAVRDYEFGMDGALTGLGFAPYLRRVRFVRHTIVPCREPLPVTSPVLEHRHRKVPVHTQVSVE